MPDPPVRPAGRRVRDRNHHCLKCPSAFASPAQLKIHADAVHEGLKPHKCVKCSAEFTKSGSLNQHVRTIHDGIKAHKCTECSAEFAYPKVLKHHMRAKHADIKEQGCLECSAKFARSNDLKQHVRLIHDGIKVHKCEKCSAEFTKAAHLKEHVRAIHDGIKHKCEICSAEFTQSGTLKRHVLVVHEKRRDHACGSCGKRYGDASNLRTHVQAVHDNPPHHDSEARREDPAPDMRVTSVHSQSAGRALEARPRGKCEPVLVSMEDAAKGRFVAEENARQQGGPPETTLGCESYWLDMGPLGSYSSDEPQETEFVWNEMKTGLKDHSRETYDDIRPVKKRKRSTPLVLKQEDQIE